MWILYIVILPAIFYWRYRSILKRKWSGTFQSSNGKNYYWLVVRGKNGPSRSDIGIVADLEDHFRFYPEKRHQRVMRWLGICSEFQTGDAEFDRQVFIVSDNFFLGDMLAQNLKARQAVTALMQLPITRIESNGQYIWVRLKKASETPPDSTHEIVGHLENLLSELRSMRELPPEADTFLWKSAIVSGINLALLAYGNIDGIADTGAGEALIYGGLSIKAAAIAFVLWSLWFLFVLWLFNRSSRGILVFFDTFFVGAFGIFATTYVALFHINTKLDTSLPETYYTTVTQRYATHSRRSTHYHVKVRHWERPGEWELMSGSYFYRNANIGSPIVITVKKGYLGYRWVESERLGR